MESLESTLNEGYRGKIQLNHGCISMSGDINSREIVRPEYYDDEKAARKALKEHQKKYEGIGFEILFSIISGWNPQTGKYEKIIK